MATELFHLFGLSQRFYVNQGRSKFLKMAVFRKTFKTKVNVMMKNIIGKMFIVRLTGFLIINDVDTKLPTGLPSLQIRCLCAKTMVQNEFKVVVR